MLFKKIMLAFMIALLAISGLTFSQSSQAQEISTESAAPSLPWFPLLGAEDASYRTLQTRRGFNVKLKGFQFGYRTQIEFRDHYLWPYTKKHGKKIKKPGVEAYLRSMHAPQAIIDDVLATMRPYLDNIDGPDTYIMRKIDEAYDDVFANCPALSYVRNIDPSSITIEFYPTAIWVPELDIWAGAVTYYNDKGLRLIKISVGVIGKLFSDPGHAIFQRAISLDVKKNPDFIHWEMGNIEKSIHHVPTGDTGDKCTTQSSISLQALSSDLATRAEEAGIVGLIPIE